MLRVTLLVCDVTDSTDTQSGYMIRRPSPRADAERMLRTSGLVVSFTTIHSVRKRQPTRPDESCARRAPYPATVIRDSDYVP